MCVRELEEEVDDDETIDFEDKAWRFFFGFMMNMMGETVTFPSLSLSFRSLFDVCAVALVGIKEYIWWGHVGVSMGVCV